MHTHIIYCAIHRGIVVYIGSGLPGRQNHVVSGVSHVYELNKLHFLKPNSVEVLIIKGYETKEESLEDEKKLILEFKPIYIILVIYIVQIDFQKLKKIC